ncbi:acyl carrier protein [Sphaerisporangium corydalis]|uniref:Acyl carrier protein n=1 Tax=Sphaerisporangium corydalis TaxID=1441875 RepID=A0ABV9ES53_9ACTN|nr:acyl carrier protein [Sphaerisporangium corydalis]
MTTTNDDLAYTDDMTHTGDMTSIEDLTELIVGVYQETLRHDGLGPDSDFYEEGGDSMTAFQIIARLRAALDTDIPVALVFACPTPIDLATAVAGLAGGLPGDGTSLN